MVDASTLQKLSRVFVTASAGLDAKSIYVARRQAHLDAASFPWVFHGLEREPGGELPYLMNGVRVFQEPSVMYLTGLNQTGVSLVLDPTAPKSARETLFIPWKDPAREFWDGIRLGLLQEEGREATLNLRFLRELLGIRDIRPAEELPAFLHDLGSRHAKLGIFHHRYPGGKALRDDPTAAFARRVTSLLRTTPCRVESIALEHYALRLPLDEWQLRECASAQEATREAFLELLPQLPRMRTEHEIAGMLEGGMLKRTPWGLAFPTICAAGANAGVLHYMKNDEPLAKGSMVLLDFGARSATMHADLSRTIPVNGKFDPLQRLLYQIVLDAQEFAEKLVRPGITIRDLNKKTWQYLEDLLEERFLAKGGKMHRPYAEGRLETLPGKSKAHPKQPHGLSHLMGEQEHDGDPFRIYQDQPLREGLMISNEPGMYGSFEIRLDGRIWRHSLGIRIEDDLVVTAKGCRNLSKRIPKHPDTLERLIQGATP
jgi:Xaa-Pro aminopeptidase